MKKLLLITSILLLILLEVSAVNYRYLYNPYTGKRDRTIKLNQSGENMTMSGLLVENPPVECPSGTYMVYTNMTNSVCISAIKTPGDTRPTGNYT